MLYHALASNTKHTGLVNAGTEMSVSTMPSALAK